MNSILEQMRRLHEEIEELERASVHQLLQKPKTHKDSMLQQTRVANYISSITNNSRELLEFYKDEHSLWKSELMKMEFNSNFNEFYDQLRSIKQFHHSKESELASNFNPNSLVKDPAVEAAELEAVFTGEESFGRHLDLHDIFLDYCNLKNVNEMNYLTFLDRFDRFKDIPREAKNQNYSTFVHKLHDYLAGWIRRSQPLYNLNKLEKDAENEFEYFWLEGTLPDWPNLEKDALYCAACCKKYAKQSVFDSHLSGKKHQKAVAQSNHSQPQSDKLKIIAKTEFIIKKLMEHLKIVREDTKSHVERKQALTEDERLDGAEEEPIPINDPESDDEEESGIHNPLKLPLGWDGKPIPFWLYKLHGLGHEFPCEICGGYIYMGRKAFDVHFMEYRHAHGLRCLGIPNSKYFQDITSIDDALALAEKLKKSARDEVISQDVIEEYEDDEGNVYDKRTFEGNI